MLTGYAVLYETESRHGLDGQPIREKITRGCFLACVARQRCILSGKPIIATLNHQTGKRYRLGETCGGGLRLFHDDRGVRFVLDCPKPKKLRGVSFMFHPFRVRRERPLLYRLDEASLWEISLITAPREPAYPQTLDTIEET